MDELRGNFNKEKIKEEPIRPEEYNTWNKHYTRGNQQQIRWYRRTNKQIEWWQSSNQNSKKKLAKVKERFFFFLNFIYLFIYLWLCWVFVSVRGLSPVVAGGGHSSSRCTGLSLSWPQREILKGSNYKKKIG